ncbi:hypothetical protein [Nitrosospira multiformis]|uniref:Uncharacterized protein n=1 Tax=Nitrosospira multiformis TaxID=1231 RepID=A0A1I7GBR3_9PROT|nr:hypothetical protein [Nitrosospira multiformis]SFU45865.1 hypothetical protein SAMN05216417_10494 [Nitrosospira multiformis]
MAKKEPVFIFKVRLFTPSLWMLNLLNVSSTHPQPDQRSLEVPTLKKYESCQLFRLWKQGDVEGEIL